MKKLGILDSFGENLFFCQIPRQGVSSIAFWKEKLTDSSISFVLRTYDGQIVAAMTGHLAKTTTEDPLFYVALVYSIYGDPN